MPLRKLLLWSCPRSSFGHGLAGESGEEGALEVDGGNAFVALEQNAQSVAESVLGDGLGDGLGEDVKVALGFALGVEGGDGE